MRKHIFLIIILSLFNNTHAKTKVVYNKIDSLRVMELVSEINACQPENPILFIARKLKSIQYVAHTLDKNSEEQLVVNLRQLDCTTYVENVLALYFCYKNSTNKFDDFCDILRRIRYKNGFVSYATRLHYFSQWIEEHSNSGLVFEVNSPNPPFSKRDSIELSYMSDNFSKYPTLCKSPFLIEEIKVAEKRISGIVYSYIPKTNILNSKLLRGVVHDGDIIAILTNKKGLDVSHVGFAVWHPDGLHLLNASMIHRKVVEESMTLRKYMEKQTSRIGIRIIRLNE